MLRFKKNKVYLIAIFILLIFSCIAIAEKNNFTNILKDNEATIDSTIITQTTVDDDNDNMYNLLKTKYINKEELFKIVEDYALLKCVYQPPKEDVDYLCNLVSKNCELERLIGIYKFWDDTDEDITLIKTLYDLYVPKMKDNKYWVEDAYNKVTNYQYGELNTDQVKEYIDKGLSYDDIVVANKLSRKGKYTINQILDTKIYGKSWIEITDDIFTKTKKNHGFAVNKNKLNDYKKLCDGNEILQSVFLSKRTGKDANEYFDMLVAKKSVSSEKADFVNQKMGKILNNLKEKGLWDESEEVKERNKKYSNNIKSKAKENGIQDCKYEELKAQGYNDLDILNASEVAKVKK